jgi:superfamily II DNA/RNA helicase
MKPEQASQTLLGITRSKAKMYEYDVPDGDHIKVNGDPGRLFTLSIGILGNFAARADKADVDALEVMTLQEGLQFSARFFDAYMHAKLDSDIDPYLMLLGSASFYLCELPGSSIVLGRSIGPKCPDIGGQGLEELLRWLLQGASSQSVPAVDGSYANIITTITETLLVFFASGEHGQSLLILCDQLKREVYEIGTPRELLLADVICSIVRKKFRNASWYALPEYTGLTREEWSSALSKPTFIRELWPSQHLLGRSGVLNGRSAVVQMPTSAGKTKAIELIIRSAFIAGRATLAVIVAPFRALCHEIRNSLVGAFRNESVNVDELSDVTQGDFDLAELLASKQILVVTPEKFVYVLRHSPELASSIGVLIFDEGHQFDSGTRGITYELLLTSLKSMVPSIAQKVLVSAVVSNAPAIGEWLNGPGSAVVSGTTLVPTFRTVAFASWLDQRGRLEFVAERDADTQEFFVPRVIEQLTLQRRPKERKDKSFPERGDGQSVALLLGLKLVKNGAVAIFCGKKTTAANLCETAVEIFDRRVDLKTPATFSDPDEIRKLHFLHAQNLGLDAMATLSAQLGIFSHHGNTPHGIRLAVEHSMRENLIRFVICTSTLAQGVNLPIRYLLVTSIYQGIEKIKVRDFHNLIGRAGRAGMHTEGSILFADPNVYDKRNNDDGKWRWDQVKQLLEPANSEPSISSLLSFFKAFQSDDHKYFLKLDAMDFTKRYVEAPNTFDEFAKDVATEHADKNFTKGGLERQISWKISVISAVESYLMSQWDAGDAPLAAESVTALAKGTFAYFLANEEDKLRLTDLFVTLSENISRKVATSEARKIYGRTLYGVANSQEIELWIRTSIAALRACGTADEALDLLWPLLTSYIQNGTFRKCDKPDALRMLTHAWISGAPFNVLLEVLETQGARLTWGTKFRKFNLEHVIEICESGLAFDGSLLIGAVAELAPYSFPDDTDDLRRILLFLQKSLKYGLNSATAIALYEAGFSDRPLVAELSAAIAFSDETRRAVVRKVREERTTVANILGKYPAYFTHVLNDVL